MQKTVIARNGMNRALFVLMAIVASLCSSPFTEASEGTAIGELFTSDAPDDTEIERSQRSVFGRVVSTNDQPVENALIELRYSVTHGSGFDEHIAKKWGQTRSDENGQFEFPRVPEAFDFQLVAQSEEHPTTKTSHFYSAVKRQQPAVIRMVDSVKLRGKVVDPQGLPLPDAHVTVYNDNGTRSNATTASDGTFSIVSKPKPGEDEHYVSVGKQGYISTTISNTREQATDGTWLIPLHTQAELTIEGRALFGDGTPVSKSFLDFQMSFAEPDAAKRRIKISPSYRVQTDAEGLFDFILPANGAFQGQVIARDPNETQSRICWSCDLPRLEPSSNPLSLHFENRGTILLTSIGLQDLPGSSQIEVNVASVGKTIHQQSVIRNKFVLAEFPTAHELSRLEPGEYQLEVKIIGSTPKLYRTQVTIPKSEPHIGIAKVHFGRDLVDSKKADEALQRPFYGAHSPPRAMSSGHATVEGTIVYDNKKSLGKIDVTNLAEPDEWISVSAYDLTQTDPKSGAFRQNVPIGRAAVVFHLEPQGLKSPLYGGFGRLDRMYRGLHLLTDAKDGETIRRDLSVPLRESCRDLAVHCFNVKRPNLAVFSGSKDGVRWIYRNEYRTFVAQETDALDKEMRILFHGFPSEKAYALITRSYSSGPMFAIKPFPVRDDEDGEVVVGLDDFGSLSVSVLDDSGKPRGNLQIRLDALFGSERMSVSEFRVPSIEAAKSGQWYWSEWLPDDSLRIPNLGVGNYFVTISDATSTGNVETNPKWSQTHVVSIQSRATTRVQVLVGHAEAKVPTDPQEE